MNIAKILFVRKKMICSGLVLGAVLGNVNMDCLAAVDLLDRSWTKTEGVSDEQLSQDRVFEDSVGRIAPELRTLHEAGILFTPQSLEAIRDGSGVPPEIDVSNVGNAVRLVGLGLEALGVPENEEVQRQIAAIRLPFDALLDQDIDLNDPDCAERCVVLVREIRGLVSLLEGLPEMQNSNLSKFANFSADILQFNLALDTATKALESALPQIKAAQAKTASTAGSVEVNIPVTPVLTATAKVSGQQKSFGATGSSLYQKRTSKGFTLGLSAGVTVAKITIDFTAESATNDISYSLLAAAMQFFESGEGSIVGKVFNKLNGLSAAASTFHNFEGFHKEVLRIIGLFGTQLVELHVVPSTVSVIVPSATEVAGLKSKSKAGSIGVAANVSAVLAKAGISLRIGQERIRYNKESRILRWFSRDFSPVGGDAATAIAAIGAKYDQLARLLTGNAPRTRVRNEQVYEETAATNPQIAELLVTLESKTKEYVEILDQLANEKTLKLSKAQVKGLANGKHQFESWLNPSQSSLLKRVATGGADAGRAGVLKALAATVCSLRDRMSFELVAQYRALFINLYNLSMRLEQELNFSKNTKGVRKFFGYGGDGKSKQVAKAKVTSYTFSGSVTPMALPVPEVGDKILSPGTVTFALTYKKTEGDPIPFQNVPSITLTITSTNGLVGIAVFEAITRIFRGLGSAASGADMTRILDDIAGCLGTNFVGSGLASLNLPFTAGVGQLANFTIVFYGQPTIAPEIRELIDHEQPGRWNNDVSRFNWAFLALTQSKNVSVGASAGLVKGSVSTSLGSVTKRTGSNTFLDMHTKYFAYELGARDGRSEADSLQKGLVVGQGPQLTQQCINVAKGNNARNEFLWAWAQTAQTLGCSMNDPRVAVFSEFENKCEGVKGASEGDTSTPDGQRAMKTALEGAQDAFIKMSNLYHRHVTMPTWEGSFKNK
jgi:hypothetical protein